VAFLFDFGDNFINIANLNKAKKQHLNPNLACLSSVDRWRQQTVRQFLGLTQQSACFAGFEVGEVAVGAHLQQGC
jgi:hypothetical protein